MYLYFREIDQIYPFEIHSIYDLLWCSCCRFFYLISALLCPNFPFVLLRSLRFAKPVSFIPGAWDPMFSKKNSWWEPGRVEQMKNSKRFAVAESFPKVRRMELQVSKHKGFVRNWWPKAAKKNTRWHQACSLVIRYHNLVFCSFVEWSACTCFLSKETEEQIIRNALKGIIYICSTHHFGI